VSGAVQGSTFFDLSSLSPPPPAFLCFATSISRYISAMTRNANSLQSNAPQFRPRGAGLHNIAATVQREWKQPGKQSRLTQPNTV
jgi:hypothetical protein